MQYMLTGFTHDKVFRVFEFEGVADDRVRTQYTVRVDLTLMRKYGIRVQELPLLCRGVLDKRDETVVQKSFTYAESDMTVHADASAARTAAIQKRKVPRRPSGENLGAAWRVPQP